MMIKKLWCLTALLWLSVFPIVAQNEYVVGYCSNELPADMKPVSLSEQEVRMSAAIRLPANKLMRYKGCQLTKIRFAVMEGFENVSVWVRTSLNTSSKVIQSVPEVVTGWNEVTLNRPLPIDGDDLYIGYTATQPASFWGILAYGEGNEYTSWLAIGNEWNDYHDHGLGILFIQGVVEGTAYDNDLAMMDLTVDQNVFTPEESVQLKGTVVNTGTNPIEGLQLHVSIDDGETETLALNALLQPEQTASFSHTLPLASLEEGRHEVVVSVDAGEAGDLNADNDVLRVPIYIYTSSYPRMMLLEHFTSLPCVNCPPVDRMLEEAVGERTDVAWVTHHVGYREDEFTLETSRNLTRFGVNGNPYIMVDRTLLGGNETPAFTIGTYTVEELEQNVFDYAASLPAFLQLDAIAHAEQDVLTIDVEGAGKSWFTELFPKATLHIFLVEDQVKSSRPQAGDPDKTIHDNITRAFVTPARGVLPTWDENAHFTYQTTFDLQSGWNQNHMRVVAFVVAQADADTNYPTGKVLNATQSKISTDVPAAIATVETEGEPEWYNVQGMKCTAPATRGIYIQKGNTTKKLFIP